MIYLFLADGVSSSLRLLRDQKEMAASLGEAGAKIAHDLDDPTTEIGKSFALLASLEKDTVAVMQQTGMTKEIAEKAQNIFKRNPSSLEDLDDTERAVIQDYWIKKKSCIAELVKKGYNYKELYS